MTIYTYQEQTKKTHSIKRAVDAANFILSEQGINKADLCCIVNVNKDDLFTLVEINCITDKIVKANKFNSR